LFYSFWVRDSPGPETLEGGTRKLISRSADCRPGELTVAGGPAGSVSL
jgi:hypothetical protein